MQNMHDQGLTSQPSPDQKFLSHCQGELTTLKIVGSVAMPDLLAFFGSYFAGTPTRYMAVDVSVAPVTHFSAAEAEGLNTQLASMPNSQGCERAAVIAPDDLHYGMSRMFATFAESKGLAGEVGIFRRHEDAEAWLGLAIPRLG